MSQVLLEVICLQADICFAVFMCLETLTFSFVLLFPPLSPSSHLFGSRLGWKRERKNPLLLINTYILKAHDTPLCRNEQHI